jgi:DNA-binding transcriptional LysR family regulator
MKIDTLGVQAFIAIAQHRGFQKAADALHISQTALTRRLQNLEAFLGVTLIERTTRSVALTTIGRDFLPQAERLLTDLAAALVEIRETGKTQRGDVTIACVPTASVQYLPRIVRAYSMRYPANRIKILDHDSSGVADAVLRREAEFGINIAESRHPELYSTALSKDRFALICRDDHPLAKQTRLSWNQLGPHRLILAGEVTANRPLLEAALDTRSLKLRPFYEVQRSATALALVAEGVAAAIVPQLAMQKGAYPRIRLIALTNPVVSRTLVMVSRKTARLSPAARALYDMIRKQSPSAGSIRHQRP